MMEAREQLFNINKIREDFPILHQKMNGKKLIYLDNSNSSQKPSCVIDAISHYYCHDNANIHRSVYALSERATQLYEKTRETIREFINAKSIQEIIFTRGTTEGINLIAQSYGRSQLHEGDEIILSAMEHHSNIVPWLQLSQQKGIVIRVAPITDEGEIDLAAYKALFNSRTKLVAMTHASNVLGTINPLKEITHIAHEHSVAVVVDGAQAFPHMPVDVQSLDCDFYVFSSHKAYGPTGVGVLYGKKELLEKIPPYQGGGSMIETVSFSEFTCNELPYKFEAGTPNIADVIGFNAALKYLQSLGMDQIAHHENDLLQYTNHTLSQIEGLRIIGTVKNKLGVVSFVMSDIHPHDIATVLDHEGIAVRAGHHCAMPLMERFKVPAMVRVSFGIYNMREEVDKLINALEAAKRLFA